MPGPGPTKWMLDAPDPTTVVEWHEFPGRRFVAGYRSYDLEVYKIAEHMWTYRAVSPVHGLVAGRTASMGAAMVEALRASDHPALAS